MSVLTENQRSLKIFIKYKQKDFTLDIDSSYDNVVDMRRVVESIEKTIDSEITFKTHIFEVSLHLF